MTTVRTLSHQCSRSGQVDHALQSRCGRDHVRDHIDSDTNGCLATRDLRLDGHVNFGRAIDVNIITSILVFQMRVNLLGVHKTDHFPVTPVTNAGMDTARYHPWLDLDLRGFSV